MKTHQRITIEMPRDQAQQLSPGQKRYLFNTMILEIATNWEFVYELMKKFKNQTLKQIDTLERDWLNFIMNNKIDILKYGTDSDTFIEENLKKL